MEARDQIYVFHTIHDERPSASIKSSTYRMIEGESALTGEYVKTYVDSNMENSDAWNAIIEELDQGLVACVNFTQPNKKRTPPFLKGSKSDIINADYSPCLECSMSVAEYRSLRGSKSGQPKTDKKETPKEQRRQDAEIKSTKKVNIFENLFEVEKK